jgi:hypothetical protein
VLTLLILLSRGEPPLLGWGTLWQIAVMGAISGILTPLWFWCFGWLRHVLQHQPLPQATFRHDREIRRGR